MYDLSILIPARNEMFLAKTVENILENIQGNTEIIVVMDGYWANPSIPDHARVTILHNHEAVGQRAATNQACRLSTAKYVMKIDAHCAVDVGFDVKMLEAFKQVGDDVTMVPAMYNLHGFNWKCKKCGRTWYQGPTPTFCCIDGDGKKQNTECSNTTEFDKEIVFKPRLNKRSEFYRFDTTLHFQYHGDRKKHLDAQGDLAETLSIQGSCFMLTREKYWKLNICDEAFGSWGQQGVEVALKTWLSGGRVLVNKNTWYSHMFRTQGGDFGFPYPLSGNQVEHARQYSRDLFYHNKWALQIYPLSWLIEKFKPLSEWHDKVGEGMLKKINEEGEKFNQKHSIDVPDKKIPTKGIVYFTDNQINVKLAHKVQNQLKTIGLPIVSSSLKPMSHFGDNIHLPYERGYLTMFKQIYQALAKSKSDIIFLCEHDVLYHSSHFNFVPKERGTIYYNINVWKVRSSDGHALWVNNCRQVSGICAYREDLLNHYRERVQYVIDNGFSRNMGFEPGTHGRVQWKYPLKAESFMSEYPNLDIRHDKNLTANRWDPSEWRDKRNCEGWTEKHISEIEGWNTSKIF